MQHTSELGQEMTRTVFWRSCSSCDALGVYCTTCRQRAAALVLIGNNFGPLQHLNKGLEVHNMSCCTVVSHAVV